MNLNPPSGSGFTNLTSLSIAALISAGIQLVLLVAAVIFFFLLLAGGVAVIMSGGGDSQGAARGREAATSAVIGLVIVFGAWAIIQLIDVFFNTNILGGLNILP